MVSPDEARQEVSRPEVLDDLFDDVVQNFILNLSAGQEES